MMGRVSELPVPRRYSAAGDVRVRIDLGYDGTDFSGWAAQPGRRTVEGELSGARSFGTNRGSDSSSL